MDKFNKILGIIDSEWVKDNPDSALLLIESLMKEIKHYREVVEIQREKILIGSAIMESMK